MSRFLVTKIALAGLAALLAPTATPQSVPKPPTPPPSTPSPTPAPTPSPIPAPPSYTNLGCFSHSDDDDDGGIMADVYSQKSSHMTHEAGTVKFLECSAFFTEIFQMPLTHPSRSFSFAEEMKKIGRNSCNKNKYNLLFLWRTSFIFETMPLFFPPALFAALRHLWWPGEWHSIRLGQRGQLLL